MKVSHFKHLERALRLTPVSVLATYNCQECEQVVSLATFIPAGPDMIPCYVVGTMFDRAVSREEPTEGRVIVLLPKREGGVTDTLMVQAEAKVRGCVYSLQSVDGFIVAAVNSSVSQQTRF
jgi:hypothetical protein